MEPSTALPQGRAAKKNRAVFPDLLKAAAMCAVVLYHAGYQPYGYLGVDIFFAVSGYLTARGLIRRVFDGSFSYIGFLKKQLLRLWPLVLLASLVCLLAGFAAMLPDDYENLAESVVASNCFANNILACITTGDYWDVVNDYKPLMHLWYLGVLMQAFVLLPLFVLAAKKLAPKAAPARSCAAVFGAVALLSFALCCLPLFSEEARFYYVPFRLFELLLGALLACAADALTKAVWPGKCASAALCAAALLPLGFLLLYTPRLMPPFARLVCVCVLSVLSLALSLRAGDAFDRPVLKAVSVVGQCTMSIFIWHQILLAFYRYCVKATLSPSALLVYLALLALLSALSWRFVEKPLQRLSAHRSGERLVLGGCAALFALTTAAALVLFFRAGVARDIPELDIRAKDAHRHMHAEYCDRIYDYDRDFSSDGRVRVLVIGNSFGRDWANVLLESALSEQIELSYCFSDSRTDPLSAPERLDEADRIFYAFSGGDDALPDYLLPYYAAGKVFFIGNKTFGDNNGQIYVRRRSSTYFDSTVPLPEGYRRQNELLKARYGEHFVDMIGAVLRPDGSVSVFSDEHKFISQDCRHLTRAGARYYARLLDLERLMP